VLLVVPALGAWTEAGVIRSGPSTCHGVALTFDLCPVKEGSGFDEPLVQELITHRLHATFFPSGRWMATHDAAVRELLAVPFFEIGTHGEEHKSLPTLTRAGQVREMEGAVKRLASQYGRKAVLFRPPYGDYNEESVSVAHQEGLQIVLWSVVSGDPDPKLPADRIAAEVERRAHNGSIVIFHANGRGWHTAEVIEDVYRHLIVEKGLAPLTVSELVAGCADHHALVPGH